MRFKTCITVALVLAIALVVFSSAVTLDTSRNEQNTEVGRVEDEKYGGGGRGWGGGGRGGGGGRCCGSVEEHKEGEVHPETGGGGSQGGGQGGTGGRNGGGRGGGKGGGGRPQN